MKMRSSLWKRYEIGGVRTKTLSVFGVTENEAKWKLIIVDIALYNMNKGILYM